MTMTTRLLIELSQSDRPATQPFDSQRPARSSSGSRWSLARLARVLTDLRALNEEFSSNGPATRDGKQPEVYPL